MSRPLHVTGSEIIVHLPASLWLLSPISRAPLCLLPCLPSTGLCERLYLLASPVPTRCPLGSREARIQERGLLSVQFSSVQFSRSLVSDSVIPWTAARQASLSITNSRSLPKLMSIESVMPSNHLMHHPFILSKVISPLFSSNILGTYRPGEFIFQCPIFLPFHTVHGVLKPRILK